MQPTEVLELHDFPFIGKRNEQKEFSPVLCL